MEEDQSAQSLVGVLYDICFTALGGAHSMLAALSNQQIKQM